MVDEEDNCCVALRVRVTETGPSGGLTELDDKPRVGWGPALETLQELIEYRFDGEAQAVLLAECEEIGWIDPTCPLRLERVLPDPRVQVFVEALILPFGDAEAAELDELFERERDPSARHWRGWEYARALEARWAEQAHAGEIPRAFLDVHFENSTAQPQIEREDREALPPLEREPLPAAE